jgi:Patatin-like phospholipase
MMISIRTNGVLIRRTLAIYRRVDCQKRLTLFLVTCASLTLIIILTILDAASYSCNFNVIALSPVTLSKTDVITRYIHSRSLLHLFGKSDSDVIIPATTLLDKSTIAEIPDGTTFGNLVLQMQQKEQAALKASGPKGLKMKDQVLELDPIPGHHHLQQLVTDGSFDRTRKDRKKEESTLRAMDIETARDLDDAVTFPSGSTEELTQNMVVLPLNPLYTASDTSLLTSNTSNGTGIETRRKRGLFSSSKQFIRSKVVRSRTFLNEKADFAFLSGPEHYLDRIERDRRHLAVSVAASIDTVDQWRQFTRERGGIFPILETIREGARIIEEQEQASKQVQSKTGTKITSQKTSLFDEFSTAAVRSEWNGFTGRPSSASFGDGIPASARGDYLEETFQMACLACRSVRDLCAISPELAAVITDSILRANAAWNGGVMQDFQTLLKYSSEYTAEKNKVRPPSKGTRTRNTLTALDTTRFLVRRRLRRDARFRCKLYVTQLLLAMTVASDDAVTAIRDTDGLSDTILGCSSFALKEQTRRWVRYPGEMIKSMWRKHRQGLMKIITKDFNVTRIKFEEDNNNREQTFRRPFLEAGTVSNDMNGSVQRISNQLLAAIGYNKWIPKMPGQRGLRILSLDGGGSRGMSAVTAVNYIMETIGGGAEVADSFDMIVGTSTGGIISFLVGLRRESTSRALTRYATKIVAAFEIHVC